MSEKQSEALQRFLLRVKAEIHSKEAKDLVEHELQAHVVERKKEWIAQGYTEEEAEKIAIKQMGNPISLGKEMQKIHKRKIEAWVIEGIGILTSILFFFSTVYLQYKNGYARDEGIYVATFIGDGLWFLLLGCILCFIIFYNTPKLKNKKLATFVPSLTLVTLVVYGTIITVGWFISYHQVESRDIPIIQSDNISLITLEELKEVINSDGSHMIYFAGKRCPLCSHVITDYEEFIEDFNLDLLYYHMTEDQTNRLEEMWEVLYSLGVYSIPTTVIIENKEVVKKFEREDMIIEMKKYFE